MRQAPSTGRRREMTRRAAPRDFEMPARTGRRARRDRSGTPTSSHRASLSQGRSASGRRTRSPPSSRAESTRSPSPSPRWRYLRRPVSPRPWQDAPGCCRSSQSSTRWASRPSRRKAACTARSWARSPQSCPRPPRTGPPLPRRHMRAQRKGQGTMQPRTLPRSISRQRGIFPLLPARNAYDAARFYCAAPEATVQVMAAAFWGVEMSVFTRAIFASLVLREIVSVAEPS